jgi:hypothetical protein
LGSAAAYLEVSRDGRIGFSSAMISYIKNIPGREQYA